MQESRKSGAQIERLRTNLHEFENAVADLDPTFRRHAVQSTIKNVEPLSKSVLIRENSCKAFRNNFEL